MLLMGLANWRWNTTKPQTTVEEGTYPWTWRVVATGLCCLRTTMDVIVMVNANHTDTSAVSCDLWYSHDAQR